MTENQAESGVEVMATYWVTNSTTGLLPITGTEKLCVGIILGLDHTTKKFCARIGVCFGQDAEADADFVLRFGSYVPHRMAVGTFGDFVWDGKLVLKDEKNYKLN